MIETHHNNNGETRLEKFENKADSPPQISNTAKLVSGCE